jgi:serine/threonine protein kinase
MPPDAPAADEGIEGIPAPGDVIGGKFVVEHVLGVGGMGVVVSARHAQLGQKVAIKFLRKDAAKSPEAANRFLREARAVVALQSAHVVRVMDVGVLDGGLPYMVMEHLDGTDLHRLLEERKTLPVSDAVDFLLQGMEAIAEAHAAGIVHRDLKPANLFLTRHPDGSPLVKVLDFGISKSSGVSQEQNLTATSTIMGSPLYMSPEQLRSSKNVDARTDVWALGVILYELLVGRLPFEAETVTGLCAKIAADAPTTLRELDASLPATLEAVVMRCLEKNVNQRVSSVAELAAALRPFASTEGRTAIERIERIGGVSSGNLTAPKAIVVAPSSGAVASTGGQTDTAWQTTSKPARSRTVYVVGAVVLVAVVLGIGVAVRFTRGASPPTVAAVPTPPPGVPSAPVVLAPPVIASEIASAPSASAAPSASTVSAPVRPTPAVGRPAPRPTAPAQPQDLLLDRK